MMLGALLALLAWLKGRFGLFDYLDACDDRRTYAKILSSEETTDRHVRVLQAQMSRADTPEGMPARVNTTAGNHPNRVNQQHIAAAAAAAAAERQSPSGCDGGAGEIRDVRLLGCTRAHSHGPRAHADRED